MAAAARAVCSPSDRLCTMAMDAADAARTNKENSELHGTPPSDSQVYHKELAARTRVSDVPPRAPKCLSCGQCAIMNPRIQYAQTSDGVNIAYAVFGAGPVVVFASTTWGSLHGAQSNTSLWAALENYPVASDRSVVLYDIMGFLGPGYHGLLLAARVLDLEAVSRGWR